MHYLQLIRYKNLIFIAFIQTIVYYAIIIPILQKYGFDANQPFIIIGLLVMGTILIAAGGYALNDYFDIKIDAINKPEKQIVGKLISREQAAILHQALTALGSISGLILAFYVRSFTLAFIFIAVPGLLWFYSASYKRQFLTGNLIVSFISALTVLVVGITSIAFLKNLYGTLIMETTIPRDIYMWTGGFSVFSFLFTWIREIIKDIEDEKGDRELECRTMPIVWGLARTKGFVYILIVLTNLALHFVSFHYIPFEGTFTLRYILFGITLPSLALVILVFKAKTPNKYHTASSLIKYIMLIGILYALVFYFMMAKIYALSLFNIFIIK